MNEYADLLKLAEKCVHCGTCRSVCPVFHQTGQEALVARGKVALLQSHWNGEIDISDYLDSVLDTCLVCGSCVRACPSAAPVDQLVVAGREELARAGRHKGVKQAALTIASNQDRLRKWIRLGSKVQSLALRECSWTDGVHPRFPLGLEKRRLLRPLAPVPLRNQFPQVVGAKQPKYRVGFFTGCSINYIYTGIGRALIKVLTHLGAEVIIPPEQQCCGMPMYSAGEIEMARAVAAKNVEVFTVAGVDAVVTACASCGSCLKNYRSILGFGTGAGAKAAEFCARIFEVTEFLEKVTGVPKDLGPLVETVTYHDPCHLLAQGLYDEPRRVLRSIPGLELVECGEASCCGGGGSFSLTHYDLAKQIADSRVGELMATGAQAVVTSCPMCLMHLSDAMHRQHQKAQVQHVIQLVEKAMGLEYIHKPEDPVLGAFSLHRGNDAP